MLLRCPLERTKSPSSSAASRMREARSGLTGGPLLPLELPQGLVELPEVQTLADPARLASGGVPLSGSNGAEAVNGQLLPNGANPPSPEEEKKTPPAPRHDERDGP